MEIAADAAQVPFRVSKIERFTKELEDGTLKLRVRDSANERALRRSRIMQVGPFAIHAGSAKLKSTLYTFLRHSALKLYLR